LGQKLTISLRLVGKRTTKPKEETCQEGMKSFQNFADQDPRGKALGLDKTRGVLEYGGANIIDQRPKDNNVKHIAGP